MSGTELKLPWTITEHASGLRSAIYDADGVLVLDDVPAPLAATIATAVNGPSGGLAEADADFVKMVLETCRSYLTDEELADLIEDLADLSPPYRLAAKVWRETLAQARDLHYTDRQRRFAAE